MEEIEIATLKRHARLLLLAGVAVSLISAVSVDAAGKRPGKTPAKRTKERRVVTSRSLTVDRPKSAQDEPVWPGYEPRQSGYDILIEKSNRKMTIFVSGKPYRTYRIYLGFTPEGHKTRRGDGCTPEGRYYICRRNARSAYYRSLLVSYPSPEDARKGVESGLVGASTLNAVIWAYNRGAVPPQNTRLGGNICIHGEGGRSRPAKDWTAGCIAVTNEEMAEIFSLIPVGTPVTILP